MVKLRFVLALLSVSFVSQITMGDELGGDKSFVEDYHAVDCQCNPCGGGHLAACVAAGGCWHNTCNMPQHHRYFPQSHGNYYFRPYNYHTIRFHQDVVTRYGGDRRNPYSNSIFADIYAEFARVEAGDERLPSPSGLSPVSASDAAAARSPNVAPSLLKFTSRSRVKINFSDSEPTTESDE